RTDARAAIGLDEACERARMAAGVGVDAVFVEAPESAAELAAVAAATPGLVRVANMIEAGRTPLFTPAELHDLGFDLIVSPLTGLFATARALSEAYGVLRAKGTLRDDLDLVTDFGKFNRLIDLDYHYGLEARYAEGE
ncbi:MAG: carboxyvinyl-carboxyphosphonate phosphorylmutase, partial [Acidimicrobiales bacterium]